MKKENWIVENVSRVYAVGLGKKYKEPEIDDLTEDERKKWDALVTDGCANVWRSLAARGWWAGWSENEIAEKHEAVCLPDGERIYLRLKACLGKGLEDGAAFYLRGWWSFEEEHPERDNNGELLWDDMAECALGVGMNGIETEAQLAEVYRQIEEKRDEMRKEAEEAFAEGCEAIFPLPTAVAA